MEQTTVPSLDGKNLDQDTFRRVWERVMPDQTGSPILVGGEKEQKTGQGAAAPGPELSGQKPEGGQTGDWDNGEQAELPQVPACQGEQEQGECLCGKVPQLCLGEQSAGDSRRLEELMNMARRGMLACQSLACRASGNCARVLGNLAADHRLALRRLSAAYFLINGKRFRPRCPAPELPSSLGLALREQFMWEQRWEHCNRQGADSTGDPCLKELYQELEQEGKLHAGAIRSLLERMA